MIDFLLSPAFVIGLLLFYWVPFALGAYLTEHRRKDGARHTWHKVSHAKRHTRRQRPIAPATA